MKSLRIGQRVVEAESTVFVIAEIGVNHDGSVGRALDLVRYAKRGGADAVKLQIFSADRLMHGSAAMATYQRNRVADNSAADMLRRYELEPAELARVVQSIRSNGMVPLATPFSVEDVETIARLDLPIIKIASPDLVNLPLLKSAVRTRLPLILSTGAATIEEVTDTVGWLRAESVRFALLHCVSSYPVANADANLCWIAEMAERFNVPVGFSDHTTELAAGAFAVAGGAVIVEKHLTYDRNASGPDHSASANPSEFEKYVEMVRCAQTMRGRAGKNVLERERDVRRVSRQSLVICRDIGAGDSIREEDLIVKRPGTGVPAGEVDRVIGRRLRRTILAGTMLQWDMLSDAA